MTISPISSNTLSNYKSQISSADANGDGVLSSEEANGLDSQIQNLMTSGMSVSDAQSAVESFSKESNAQTNPVKTQSVQPVATKNEEQGKKLDLMA